MPGEVLIQRNGAVVEVVLNRPHRRNALVGPMIEELLHAIETVSSDPGVNALLLRGEGGAFCSGVDLDAVGTDPPPPWLAGYSKMWVEIQVALYRCPVPIIGALERFAINGGGPLASCCDLLIAGETAYLQVGEVRQGTSPAMNVAWLLLRHGEAVAMRVALTGDRVLGPELLRLGIATEVVPDAQVLARAREIAASMASFPPEGVRKVKAMIRGIGTLDDPEDFFRQGFDWHNVSPGRGTLRVGKASAQV